MKRTTLALTLLLSVICFSCLKLHPQYMPPSAPTNLQVQIAGSNSVSITWTDNSGNEEIFSIEVKTGTGSFAECGNPVQNTTAYIIANLITGQTYTFRIRAFGDKSYSSYSNEVSVTL